MDRATSPVGVNVGGLKQPQTQEQIKRLAERGAGFIQKRQEAFGTQGAKPWHGHLIGGQESGVVEQVASFGSDCLEGEGERFLQRAHAAAHCGARSRLDWSRLARFRGAKRKGVRGIGGRRRTLRAGPGKWRRFQPRA